MTAVLLVVRLRRKTLHRVQVLQRQPTTQNHRQQRVGGHYGVDSSLVHDALGDSSE